MYFVLESIFVGFYFVIWYKIISFIINDFYSVVFISGFFKHFFGYYLGLQTFYCQYGEACNKIHNNNNNNNDKKIQGTFSNDELLRRPPRYFSKNNPTQLFITSIIEGLSIIFIVYLINFIISNKIILIFTVGALLHIISEILGIHRNFCKYNCACVD